MKATAKNAGFAKALLLNHGEKIGMLVFVGVAGWLLFASLGAEGTEKQPGELTRIVQTANTNIDNFSAADAPAAADDPTNSLDVASTWQAQAADKVDPELYAAPLVWDRSPVPPIVLRTDPVLLAAIELEGFGLTAPLATMDEATRAARADEEMRREAERELDRRREREAATRNQGRNEGPGGFGGMGMEGGYGGGPGGDANSRPAPVTRRGTGLQLSGEERIDLASFACVTALVPIQDQWKLYQDAFANAQGFDRTRDVPKYLGCLVERKEVGGSGDWQPVKVVNVLTKKSYPLVSSASIQRSTQNWISGQELLADNRYLHPDLSFPLPPVVGKSFGREVVHSSVPLQIETDAENAANQLEPEQDEPLGDDDLLGRNDGRMGGMEGGMGMGGRRYGGGGMGMEGGYGGGGMGMEGGMGGGRGGRGIGGEFTISSAPHVMVRFFDFTVRPGKRYRYRIQLILEDANSKAVVSANDLDKEAKQRVASQKLDGKVKFRKTDWSEQSKIISVPAAGEVYVANVKPAPSRQVNGEPTAELLVKSYDIDETNRARQAEKIMPFSRGAVLNRTEKDLEILSGRNLVKIESFSFKTNVTLLDIEGGDKISRDVSAPGRVLLMDASGRVYVEDQSDSKSEVDMHNLIFAEPEDNRRGGPGGYGGGMEGGFEGFGL